MKTLLLFAGLLISSFSFSQLSAGLIAQYDFSGDALDVSGNNNHGVVTSATLVNDRQGNPLSAYHFDGVDDNIFVPAFPNTHLNYSFCAWIKADIVDQNDKGILNQVGTHTGLLENMTSFGIATMGSEDRIFGRHRASDGTFISASDNLDIDLDWHFITTTFDGDSLKFYKDGVLENFTLINSSAPKIDTLLIGCGRTDDTPFGFFFEGSIDDIRIYNREITDCEIEELYTGVNPCTIGLEEVSKETKKLIKIVDVLGRETPFKPNTPLLYIYNDGTVERKMIIKE